MRAPARGYLPNCRMVPGCKAASPCKRGRVKEEGEASSRPWLFSQAVGGFAPQTWQGEGRGRGELPPMAFPPGCRTAPGCKVAPHWG